VNDLEFSKKKQTKSRGGKRRVKRAERDAKEGASRKGDKEAPLQKQLDDMIDALHLVCFRISDAAWRLIVTHWKPYQADQARKYLAGHADSNVLIPITNRYSLCCHVECKSDIGRLHGVQKGLAEKLPFQITRTPKKSQEIIYRFMDDAEKIKKILEREGFDNDQDNLNIDR